MQVSDGDAVRERLGVCDPGGAWFEARRPNVAEFDTNAVRGEHLTMRGPECFGVSAGRSPTDRKHPRSKLYHPHGEVLAVHSV